MTATCSTTAIDRFEEVIRMFQPADRRAIRKTPAPGGTAPKHEFDKASIAALSRDQIEKMPTDELVRVVRSSKIPFIRGDAADRLGLCDLETLRRLAFLARRTCRNQGY